MTKLYTAIIAVFIAISVYTCYRYAYAAGTTYYISFSAGNDANPGTSQNLPWKTLTNVQTKLTAGGAGLAGTKFLFNTGDQWTWTGTAGAAMLNFPDGTNGTATAPIVFGTFSRGLNTAAPVFDGGNGLASMCFGGLTASHSATTGTYAFAYITISGFECRNTSTMGIAFQVTTGPDPGMPGIIVSNNLIHNTGQGCFGSTAGSTCTTALDQAAANSFWQCGTYCNQLMWFDEAFTSTLAGPGPQFINNTVHDGGGHNLITVDGDSTQTGLIQGSICYGYKNNCIDVRRSIDEIVKNNQASGPRSIVGTGGAAYYYENTAGVMPIPNGHASIYWMNNLAFDIPNGFECEGLTGQGALCNAYNNTFFGGTATNCIVSTSTTATAWCVENTICDTNTPLFVCNASDTNTCNEIVNWDYNDPGGHTGGSPVINTLVGMTSFGVHDQTNIDPHYTSTVSSPPAPAGSFLLNQTTSTLFGTGDGTLTNLTQNSNIGWDASIVAAPTVTPSPTPGTPTPSTTPTPTPTTTPTVSITLHNLHALGAVGIQGNSGGGDSIAGVNLDDFVDPRAYGAKCDGVTDDSSAFTSAMAYVNSNKKILLIPNFTCLVNSTLNLTANGAGISGYSTMGSVLTTTVAGLNQINVTAVNFRLANFRLTRSVTATAGGNGITINGIVAGPTLDHILVTNAWIGFNLGSASYARLEHLQTFGDQSDGVLMTQTGGSALQWTIDDVLSELNVGDGFHVVGTTLTNLAPWRQPYTFSNEQYGIDIEDSAGILDGQISDWTSSADCLAGININGGGNMVISGGYEEFAGKFSSLICTTITGQGNGIVLTAGMLGDIMIDNNTLTQNLYNGIQSSSPKTVLLSNNSIKLNGASGIALIGSAPGIVQLNGGTSQSNSAFGLLIGGTQPVYQNGLYCANNSGGNRSGNFTNGTLGGGPC